MVIGASKVDDGGIEKRSRRFKFAKSIPMRLQNSVRPIIDSIVLSVALVVANLIFGAGDRGWMGLNPSPYLLLPLLIGGKYGLRAGLLAGLGALLLSAAMACTEGRGLMEVLSATPLVFLAMPVVGLLSGELQRQSSGRRRQLEAQSSDLGRAKQLLEKDLELSRESQYVLQKELSLLGADVCSLDIELRKIFEEGAPPVLHGTLLALSEVSGLTDAAFYLLDETGESLSRAEYVGDGAYFPDEIGAKHTKMAWAAIESGELVTCRGLGEGLGGDIGKARFLAALPWKRGAEVVGVLLIHDMPFLSMNWQTLARIELVCEWVAAIDGLRARGGDGIGVGVDEPDEFKVLLGMAGRSFDAQGLASSVILLTAAGVMAGGEIRAAIAAALRPTDVVIDVGEAGLAVLSPLEAGRDAEAAAARMVEAAGERGKDLSVQRFDTGADGRPGAIWEELENASGRV